MSEPSDEACAEQWRPLAQRFATPEVLAIALMGSHARGDAGPLSDVDLLRFTSSVAPVPHSGSHLLDGRLVVVSDVRLAETEEWFIQPRLASGHIGGLRQARPLLDPRGAFAALQARARDFVWDAAMQARADAFAGEMMVGLIEEVHKGLEGLRRDDTGRLLNAEFGLSWLLSRAVQVQRGVLLAGDNTFLDQVEEAVGRESSWCRLHRQAFGAADDDPPLTLRRRVIAGLRLYVATAALLAPALTPASTTMVRDTMRLIRAEVG